MTQDNVFPGSSYSVNPEPTGGQIRAVGIAQRRIMWVLLLSIAVTALLLMQNFNLLLPPPATQLQWVGYVLVELAMRLIMIGLMMVAIFKLGAGLGMSMGARVAFMIGTIIPFLGMILLLIINQKATNYLRARQVKVGLIGAKLADLPEV